MIAGHKPSRRAWPVEAPPTPATLGASPAAGALRRIWSFGVLLLLVGYAVWNLAHAITRGEVRGGHGWAHLRSEPADFWFHVVLDGLVVLVVGGGAALLVFARLRRRDDTRRLDAYLQGREDARRGL